MDRVSVALISRFGPVLPPPPGWTATVVSAGSRPMKHAMTVALFLAMEAGEVIRKPFDPMTLATSLRTIWDRAA